MNNIKTALVCSISLSALLACSSEFDPIDTPIFDSASEVAGSRDGPRAPDHPGAEVSIATLSAQAHCEAVIASVRDAGFEEEAWVSCTQNHALIHSDSFPSHEVMAEVIGTNEQIPWPAPGYYAPVKFNPAFSGIPINRDSSMAIAVNGIPIFDYTVGGELDTEDLFYHQPHLDAMTRGEIDNCGGHAGKGDDYHYHELPRCMLEQMENKDENPIIGWGFDGFPLYGNNNPDGSAIEPGTLDVCNGQLDPVFGYRYHTSDEQPYIVQCLVGEVDFTSAASVGMSGLDGARRPASFPIEVEDMSFSMEDTGAARLDYHYQGESYFMAVAPTDEPNCYLHSWKVIGNENNPGNNEDTGVFCHLVRTGGGGGMGGMGAP